MKKIKIGFFASDNAGVGHYRTIWGGQQIHRMFGNEFDVTIGHNTVDYNNVEYFKQFDIVHFHRQLGPFELQEKLLPQLKEAGVITIMDIDDYWLPPKTHPMYMNAQKEEIEKKTLGTFKAVEYVTTTTDIFAGYIRRHNQNVHVIPNGIDMKHPMWKEVDQKKSDKLRISWIGGSSHLHDLKILQPSMNILHNDVHMRDKYQIVMCGYDVRGTITNISEDGKHESTRKIEPHETIWNQFESIFTDNYNPAVVDAEYKKYLQKYKNVPYTEDVLTKNYVRRWTLPLTRYGEHYNFCDVCLAPLENNTFNEVKSELKIIEAGMRRKAIIAQDYSIYKKLLTNGENGILVPLNRPRDWYEAIKKLIKEPGLAQQMGDNLHEFVKDKYSLEAVTLQRVELYRKLYKEKHAPVELAELKG